MGDGLKDGPHARAYRLPRPRLQHPPGRIDRQSPVERNQLVDLSGIAECTEERDELRIVAVVGCTRERDTSKLIHAPVARIDILPHHCRPGPVFGRQGEIALPEHSGGATHGDRQRVLVACPSDAIQRAIEPVQPLGARRASDPFARKRNEIFAGLSIARLGRTGHERHVPGTSFWKSRVSTNPAMQAATSAIPPPFALTTKASTIEMAAIRTDTARGTAPGADRSLSRRTA